MTTRRVEATPPHVHAVEWTAWERVFLVDGEEQHRERRDVALPRQRIVRSVLTCDYEVVEVIEPPCSLPT